MQKKGANISLKGYDDIFSTDQSRAEAQQERVQEIPLSELHPFEGHPFRVVDDEEMMKTAESVRDFGVLTPAIVRPDPDGGYHIRKYCHRCFGIGNNGRNADGNGFGSFARLVPAILYRAGHDVRFGNHHLCDRLRSND